MNPYYAIAGHMSGLRNIGGILESVPHPDTTSKLFVSSHDDTEYTFTMSYVTWPRFRGGCQGMAESSGRAAKHFAVVLQGVEESGADSFLMHAVVLENPMSDRHKERHLVVIHREAESDLPDILPLHPVPDILEGRSLVLIEPVHTSHARATATHHCRGTVVVSRKKLSLWWITTKVATMKSCVEVADSFWDHFHPMRRWSRLRDRLRQGTTLRDVLPIRSSKAGDGEDPKDSCGAKETDVSAHFDVTLEELYSAAWDIVEAEGERNDTHAENVKKFVEQGYDPETVSRFLDVAAGDSDLAEKMLKHDKQRRERSGGDVVRRCDCLGAGSGFHKKSCKYFC